MQYKKLALYMWFACCSVIYSRHIPPNSRGCNASRNSSSIWSTVKTRFYASKTVELLIRQLETSSHGCMKFLQL
jgi:hypothetical protein